MVGVPVTSFVFGRIPQDTYEQAITGISIVIVIFSGWLFLLMLTRMIRSRHASGHDLAAMTYVLSTCAVFFVIAGRTIFSWPKELTLTILLIKAASVVIVTLWARAAKLAEPEHLTE